MKSAPPVPWSRPARDAPRLVAHRGVPVRAPENSRAGFLAARELGAESVELDARPTRDGLMVVLHDETPERVFGPRGVSWERDADELLAMTYLVAPDERMILLDEALALLAGRTLVDLELKPSPGIDAVDIAERAIAALVAAGSPGEVVVTSSDTAILEAVKERAPAIATGLVFGSRDARDPVDTAVGASASLVVANHRRIDEAMARSVRDAGLELWAYTVDRPDEASRLAALGCAAIVTDDLPGMSAALERTGAAPAREAPGELILALDLGSSSVKGALVDTRRGIVEIARRETPRTEGAAGKVTHDPRGVADAVHELIAELATRASAVPSACALASQRSTGTWFARDGHAPLAPAPSWRDARGEEIVASLAEDREELERIARLPLAPAWTALRGAMLLGGEAPPRDRILAPLGSFVAAELTGDELLVDPTLANRMFLVDAARGVWSDRLLDAFRLTRDQLPRLVPTVGRHGSIAWPGSDARIPLTALIGDQQAAFVGASGAQGDRLLASFGTGIFVMRAGKPDEPLPEGGRRAPIFTSAAQPLPRRVLIELPVEATDGGRRERSWTETATSVARRVARGETADRELCTRVARAIDRVVRPTDRTVVIGGGVIESPHLVKLLDETSPLATVYASERELTLLGAARLAAAAVKLLWGGDPGGGLSAPRFGD